MQYFAMTLCDFLSLCTAIVTGIEYNSSACMSCGSDDATMLRPLKSGA